MSSLNFYLVFMIVIFINLSSQGILVGQTHLLVEEFSNKLEDNLLGESPIDDFLNHEDLQRNRTVVDLVYQDIKSFHLDNIYLDTLLNISLIRTGTPYKWGGSNWNGIDCSHFTFKIYQTVGLYYSKYMTTYILKDVKDKNGLIAVPPSEMKPGDLLVYGFYDQNKQWHGHVVLLVDSNYSNEKYTGDNSTGLTVGSHGDGIGVEFIIYEGFPNYYIAPYVKLRTVLRIKDLNTH